MQQTSEDIDSWHTERLQKDDDEFQYVERILLADPRDLEAFMSSCSGDDYLPSLPALTRTLPLSVPTNVISQEQWKSFSKKLNDIIRKDLNRIRVFWLIYYAWFLLVGHVIVISFILGYTDSEDDENDEVDDEWTEEDLLVDVSGHNETENDGVEWTREDIRFSTYLFLLLLTVIGSVASVLYCSCCMKDDKPAGAFFKDVVELCEETSQTLSPHAKITIHKVTRSVSIREEFYNEGETEPRYHYYESPQQRFWLELHHNATDHNECETYTMGIYDKPLYHRFPDPDPKKNPSWPIFCDTKPKEVCSVISDSQWKDFYQRVKEIVKRKERWNKSDEKLQTWIFNANLFFQIVGIVTYYFYPITSVIMISVGIVLLLYWILSTHRGGHYYANGGRFAEELSHLCHVTSKKTMPDMTIHFEQRLVATDLPGQFTHRKQFELRFLLKFIYRK
jgi:hypothetical protein